MLKMELQRVQKLLSNYGYCSRRKAEDLIIDGRVKVNGKLITIGDKATKNETFDKLQRLKSGIVEEQPVPRPKTL